MEGEGEGKGEGEKEKEKRFNGREFHHFPASGESNASYVSPPPFPFRYAGTQSIRGKAGKRRDGATK
jgi:hypothetical protein